MSVKDDNIHNFIKCGDIEAVRIYIKNGYNLESIDFNGQTPLHIACFNRMDKIVYELLQQHPLINVNAKDNFLRTPLHLLCRYKYPGINTMYAFELKRCEIILKYLLDCRANVNELDLYGNTVLHLIALNNQCTNMEIPKLLINYGIKIDAQNYNNCTALHLACSRRNVTLVKFLFEYLVIDEHLLNLNDRYEHNCLMYVIAERTCSLELTKLFLENGIQLNFLKSDLIDGLITFSNQCIPYIALYIVKQRCKLFDKELHKFQEQLKTYLWEIRNMKILHFDRNHDIKYFDFIHMNINEALKYYDPTKQYFCKTLLPNYQYIISAKLKMCLKRTKLIEIAEECISTFCPISLQPIMKFVIKSLTNNDIIKLAEQCDIFDNYTNIWLSSRLANIYFHDANM